MKKNEMSSVGRQLGVESNHKKLVEQWDGEERLGLIFTKVFLQFAMYHWFCTSSPKVAYGLVNHL